jgi:hypothetical protein
MTDLWIDPDFVRDEAENNTIIERHVTKPLCTCRAQMLPHDPIPSICPITSGSNIPVKEPLEVTVEPDILFQPWPKIARLNRDIVITEKIDGTNSAIHITPSKVVAQSRNRLIFPGKDTDNFGFAAWVQEHEQALRSLLGEGLHFGEWWGQGIGRNYELDHKRFSLFNTAAWGFLRRDITRPALPHDELALGIVPILYEGPFSQDAINEAVNLLRYAGSQAVPGFQHPEGIVVFHTASREMYKVTIEKDDKPKSQP